MQLGNPARVLSVTDVGSSKPDSDGTTADVSPDQARAVVADAVEARRARPGLTISLGLALARPLNTESSSGLAIGMLGAGAAIAVYFGAKGGVVGWVLGTIGVIVTVLGLISAWAVVPHDIRVFQHHRRTVRLTKRLAKAAKLSRPGSADPERITIFRRVIVEGSLFTAALGVCMLHRELAGDDATAEEVSRRRSPVWPAWSYHHAITAEHQGDLEVAEEHLEQTFATAHPVWATAAAVGLLDRLNEIRDRERVALLTEWIQRSGDSAVVTELLFYR